jgi:hypothetical protein
VWLSTEEVLKQFPSVSKRTLKYWRESKKIMFNMVRQRTSYLESSIRAQVAKQNIPKKYFGIRKSYIKKKLASINPGIALLIIAAGLVFVNMPIFFNKKQTYTLGQVYFIVYFLLALALVYFMVQLIRYLWRNSTSQRIKNNHRSSATL